MTFHDRRSRRSTPCSRRKRRASTRLTTGARTVARSAPRGPSPDRGAGRRRADDRRRRRAAPSRVHRTASGLAAPRAGRRGRARSARTSRGAPRTRGPRPAGVRRAARSPPGPGRRRPRAVRGRGRRRTRGRGSPGARPAPRSSAVRFATTVCSVFSGTDITSSTASNDESAPYSPRAQRTADDQVERIVGRVHDPERDEQRERVASEDPRGRQHLILPRSGAARGTRSPAWGSRSYASLMRGNHRPNRRFVAGNRCALGRTTRDRVASPERGTRGRSAA